jgi:hypothetical protein
VLGLQRPSERSEQRRLAGTVRPERRDDLTRRDLQGDIANRDDRAVGDR